MTKHPAPDATAAEALLAQSFEDAIANGEIVTTPAQGSPPISIRLSAPLLDRLDRLATAQHRKRSNLIQHILWEYVHAQEEPRTPVVSATAAVTSPNGSARPKRA